jgi:N-methylhydantoinase A
VSLDGIKTTSGLDEAGMAEARDRFDRIHARIHGHAAKEKPVEIVSYRVRVRVKVPKYKPVPENETIEATAPQIAEKGIRDVWFTSDNTTKTKIWDRSKLPPGTVLTGPAIVEQIDSTTVIPSGWLGRVDTLMNLILTRT